MAIAVIPARGGSKRIPRKNIRLFQGTPVIGLTIKTLQDSGIFTHILVSTEDPEIGATASKFGAKILWRDLALSDDYTTTQQVMKDSVESIPINYASKHDPIFCVYPVTPFLTKELLHKGLAEVNSIGEGYVLVAQECRTPPERVFYYNKQGELEMPFPGAMQTRTQDFHPKFVDAGLFYAASRQTWSSGLPIFSPSSKFIEIGRFDSVDVDQIQDWEFAEEIYKFRVKKTPTSS